MKRVLMATLTSVCAIMAQESIREEFVFNTSPQIVNATWAVIPTVGNGCLKVYQSNRTLNSPDKNVVYAENYDSTGTIQNSTIVPFHDSSKVQNVYLFGKKGSVLSLFENSTPTIIHFSAEGSILKRISFPEHNGIPIVQVKFAQNTLVVQFGSNHLKFLRENGEQNDFTYTNITGFGTNDKGEVLLLSQVENPELISVLNDEITGEIDSTYDLDIEAMVISTQEPSVAPFPLKKWKTIIKRPLDDIGLDAEFSSKNEWVIAGYGDKIRSSKFSHTSKRLVAKLSSEGKSVFEKSYLQRRYSYGKTPYSSSESAVQIAFHDSETYLVSSCTRSTGHNGQVTGGFKTTYTNEIMAINENGDSLQIDSTKHDHVSVIAQTPTMQVVQRGSLYYWFRDTVKTPYSLLSSSGVNKFVVPSLARDTIYGAAFSYNDAIEIGNTIIAVGTTNQFGGGNSDLLLSRISSDGTVVSHLAIGDSSRETGAAVAVLGDDGMIAGSKNDTLTLWKIDTNGIVQKRINLGIPGTCQDLETTADGFLLMAQRESKLSLYRIDRNGTVLSSQTIDSIISRNNSKSEIDYAYEMVPFAHGWVFTANSKDSSMVIQIDSTGKIVRSRSFPRDSIELTHVAVRGDKFHVAYEQSVSPYESRFFVLDGQLNTLHHEPIVVHRGNFGHRMLEDGSYLVLGDSTRVRQYSSTGDVLWKGSSEKQESYMKRKIIPIANGRFLTVGTTAYRYVVGHGIPAVAAPIPHLSLIATKNETVGISAPRQSSPVVLAVMGKRLTISGVMQKGQLEIYSVAGKKIQTVAVERSGTIDLSALPSGMYISRLTAGQTRIVHKMILN